MKKPEKRKINERNFTQINDVERYGAIGYNQCWEDYDKFLPDEGEIKKIVQKVFKERNHYEFLADHKAIAKAISRRLGK